MLGGEADWVSGVQVALRADNYIDAGYRDTDWDGEQTLSIPDDAVNPWFQWFKLDCDGGSALYDMTADQRIVYIPIDCPQHHLTLQVYDEESWNGRTGRLMSGVSVRVDSPRYPYYFRTVELQTDRNGQIELLVPAGDYQIELNRSDCARAATIIKNVAADRSEPLFIDCAESTRTPVHGGLQELVPDLGADLAELGVRAAAPLRNQHRALRDLQDLRMQLPRLDEHFRILDRDFVKQLVSGPGESFDNAHFGGVKEAAAPQPGFIGKAD